MFTATKTVNTTTTMNKIVNYTLIVFSVLLLVVSALIFRPVPIVTEDEAITETGVVANIFSNQGNDIIFRLAKTKRRFYINRGLEHGLELNALKDQLVGNNHRCKTP